MYDVEDGSIRASRSRPMSLAFAPLQKPRSWSRATTRPSERISFQPPQTQSSVIQQDRGRLTAREFAGNVQYYRESYASASSNANDHVRNRVSSQSAPISRIARPKRGVSENLSSAADSLDDDAQTSNRTRETRSSEAVAQLEIFDCPSKTQLLRDADTFQHYRTCSIARKWFTAAAQATHHHKLLERKAFAHDAQRLLHESLEQWQQQLRSKRHAAETERFFNRLELRAGKARDLYLLSKAFTHWAECAYDVAAQKSTARRHILRFKYFNTWLEITAVNALKARRLRLQKFIGVWRQRYVREVADEARAAVLYKDYLCKLGYWRLFWTFCGRRAPEWRASRLKRKYFSEWTLALRQDSQRNRQVKAVFNEKIVRRILAQWLAKTRIILSQAREAIQYNHQKTGVRLLWAWRLKIYYAPLGLQISNMVDWRVAGTTFSIFVSRYRVERQAEEINRLRLMRNAWTQWNDRLRCRTLAHQIDDRAVIEALYKWVLAERYSLLHRLYKERLKLRHLSKLVNISYNLQAQRNNSLRAFEGERNRRCLHSVIVSWRQRFASHRQDEEVAFQFNAPRIAQENLHKWISKSTHLRKLDGWVRDAEFYFLATRILKCWRSATTESKRQKRRDAYIQIRRKSKMQLATRCLAHWRGRTAQSLRTQETAQHINQDRLVRYGANLFDKWRARFTEYSNWTYQAEDYYTQALTSHHIDLWRHRLRVQLNSEEIARLFLEPHLSSHASSFLHKCRLRMIEFKALASKAVSLEGTYDKRHLRRHLRQWLEKTAARRKLQPTADPTTSSSKARRRALQAEVDAGDEGLTTRAEEWTALDLGEWIPALEAQSSTTPLPAYLGTPSKRAARARALVKVSTTPAETPFRRRLGSQFATEPMAEPSTGRRVAFGRTTIGARLGDSVFGAIMEDESPRTPTGPL